MIHRGHVSDVAARRGARFRVGSRAVDLAERINAAADALTNAQNQADRDSAKAKLEALQQVQAALHAEIAQAKATAARAERLRSPNVP